MNDMTLEDVLLATKGQYFGKDIDLKKMISGVVIDSRKMEKGNLFVAIKGERVDGHNFISSVIEAGAAASLCEERQDVGLEPYILVPSTLQAIKDLAGYYRSKMNVKVIGISGSVGKTSTKEMVASVLSEQFSVLKTMGNFNNEIGMPLTLLRIEKEHEAAVIEMGISDFGEMSRLSKIARPDIALLTNIGQCHLENLQDRNGVFKAKSEMFDYIATDGTIILNGEDDILSQVGIINGKKPIFYGLDENNDVFARNIIINGLDGSSFEVCVPSKFIEFRAQLGSPGKHMIINALAAVAVGVEMGMESARIKQGIEKFENIKGRVNIIKIGGKTIIDDCYNANPTSMKASIDLLADSTGRKVAILGDMLELGDKEQLLHEEIGEYLTQKRIEILICVGNRAEFFCKRAGTKVKKSCFKTNEETIKQLPFILQDGDTILIKASHGMHFEEITDWLTRG